MADVPQAIDTTIGTLVDEYETIKHLKILCSKKWGYKFKAGVLASSTNNRFAVPKRFGTGIL